MPQMECLGGRPFLSEQGTVVRPVALEGGQDLKAAAVITKVGLDHQEFLGNTLRDITLEKCGIFSPGSKVIYDETNAPEVIRQIRQSTRSRMMWPIAPGFHYWPHLAPPDWSRPEVGAVLERRFAGQPHMLANARVAYNVLVNVHPIFFKDLNLDHGALAQSIAQTVLPGRMQRVTLEPLTGAEIAATLDGAHNRQAMDAVAPVFKQKRIKFAERRNMDEAEVPTTWLFAFSEGKDLDDLLEPLDIRPGDRVGACEFGPVDGMPWKRSISSSKIDDHVSERYPGVEDCSVSSRGSERGAQMGCQNTCREAGSDYMHGKLVSRLRYTESTRLQKGEASWWYPESIHIDIN